MQNSIAEMKRSGSYMARAIIKDIMYPQESNHYASNPIRQLTFLTKLLENGGSSAVKDIETLLNLLTDPAKVQYHVCADFKSIPSIEASWPKFTQGRDNASNGANIETSSKTNALDKDLISEESRHAIVGLGTVESSFLRRCTKSISDYNDPDVAALMVYLKYLTQLEGPMWKKIRGVGLSYGYRMDLNIDEGQLYFSLTKSTDIFKAYKASLQIVESYLDGKEKWDSALLESAKTSMIYDLIENEKTLGDSIGQSLFTSLRGLDADYRHNLFSAISKVTESDLTRVGKSHVRSIFDSSKSKTSIVCHSSKVEQVVKGFDEMNVKMEVLKSLDKSFLSKL